MDDYRVINVFTGQSLGQIYAPSDDEAVKIAVQRDPDSKDTRYPADILATRVARRNA